MSGLQQVHVRITDAATGKPTPCRVRFTDAAGKYYAPYGRLTEFASAPGVDVGGNLWLAADPGKGPIQFAYIDGSCEIALPAGSIDVAICKGPEYVRLQQQIHLAAGKLALRFTLERSSDFRREGWYPGDIRAHCLSPHAALLEGAAEDLAVVNVLACMMPILDLDEGLSDTLEHRWSLSNVLAFSGQQPALQNADCLVVVNTHNSHYGLGALGLLNCHRMVYPLTFGRRHRFEGYDNWALADWCDQCHRKNGLVVWTCTHSPNHLGEALADLILGKVDAFEVDSFGEGDQDSPPWASVWYDLLNCGFRVPLVGGSAKDSNVQALGCTRTYARLLPDQPLAYGHWIEAVRAGRTFATNGPLLSLTADGHDPGTTVAIRPDQPIHIRAEARSQVPIDCLEIIVNGKVVAQQAASASPSPSTAKIEVELRLPEGGWLAARCGGQAWLPSYFPLGQRVSAHTSPVYVEVEGRPCPVDAAAAQRLLGHLAHMLTWVDHEGRYENDTQRLRLRKIFEEAIASLQKRISG